MPKSRKPNKEAAPLIRHHVTKSGLNRTFLADQIGTTPAYLGHLVTGYRTPSPTLINMMSEALNLTLAQTVQLHQAAARDHGFKIDLKEEK